jgi:hypothetical protein
MESRTLPSISCMICAKPVDLTLDLCTDENGSAVHEKCYVKDIASRGGNPQATTMVD